MRLSFKNAAIGIALAAVPAGLLVAAAASPAAAGVAPNHPGCHAAPYEQRGSHGACVQGLQMEYNRHIRHSAPGYGELISEDGQFGPATERAVRNYQWRECLYVDGVAGPSTWGKTGWMVGDRYCYGGIDHHRY